MTEWDKPWRESKTMHLQGSESKGRCVPVEVSLSRESLKVVRVIASTTSGEVHFAVRVFFSHSSLSPDDTVKHDVTHFIDVTGPSVSAQPRHLHQTVSAWPSKSFNICFSLASSDPLLVPGLPHFTWYPRRLWVTGDPVVTIVLLIVQQYQIVIPFLTCMTFLPPYRVPPFFPSWTWCPDSC